MKLYSLMSGTPPDFSAFSSDWWMAWVGLGIIVIMTILGKKWLGEEELVGFPFSWVGSLAGLLAYVLVVSLTGSYRWSFIIGLVAFLVGGFGLGATSGGSG